MPSEFVQIVRSGKQVSPPAPMCFRKENRRFRIGKSLVGGVIMAFLAVFSVPSAGVAMENSGHPPRLDGYSSQFTILRPVRPVRLTPFRTVGGEPIDLSRFRGKVVLLNFWATWCAPCVYEMPSLNRLASDMRGKEFAVVPIAIDERGIMAAERFYREHGLDQLTVYSDPEQRTAYRSADNPQNAEFALYGLPITYIIDHRGRARGYIAGAVNWQSAMAKAFLDYFIRHVGPD